MELTAFITSIRATYEIAKGLKATTDKAKFAIQASELLERLLSVEADADAIRSEHNALIQEKTKLLQRLKELEDWQETESEYELTEICPKIFVYAYKKMPNPTQPDHWLCPNCWQDKKKSILQGKSERSYGCPRCKFSMMNSNEPPPPQARMRINYR